MDRRLVFAAIVIVWFLSSQVSLAADIPNSQTKSPFTTVAYAGPGFSPSIIATGEERRRIQSTPITHRPNRPLHFYGNAVRRAYWRGR